MKNVKRSEAFYRKRKMMLMLPVLMIPFLTLAFWAMGGGKGSMKNTDTTVLMGLNLKLPDANVKEETMTDKLSFYDRADKDSAKMAEMIRSDPYYRQQKTDSVTSVASDLEQLTQTTASKYNQHLNTSPINNNQANTEQKIMDKLSLLKQQMNQADYSKHDQQKTEASETNNNELSSQVDRLENMMQTMNSPGQDDPDMKQLNGTLDKILDIQHPERIQDRVKEKSLQHKTVAFGVSKEPVYESISLLDTGKAKIPQTGFYGIDKDLPESPDQNGIEAVIHENQVLVNGAIIKLRLCRDVYINGNLIPKGNLVFGYVSLNDERLTVEINSIVYRNSFFPVKLQVYDLDGLEGIYIPGAITRDVAKQATDNSLQLMELSSMDPSLKAQAASAGISAAKSLISKKVKLIKVTVKAGYRLLLKDKNME